MTEPTIDLSDMLVQNLDTSSLFSLILRNIKQEDIYAHYMGVKPSTTGLFYSPFRSDSNPSCKFFVATKAFLGGHTCLLFYDHQKGTFSVFSMVRELKNLASNRDAALHIARSFNLFTRLNTELLSTVPVLQPVEYKTKTGPKKLQCELGKMSKEDLWFWHERGLSAETLRQLRIYRANRVWIERKLFHLYTDNDPMYVYLEGDTMKVYRPFADKAVKWRTNFSASTVCGLDLFPKKSVMGIITSSRKDVGAIMEATDIPAVSGLSESSLIPRSAVKHLLNSCDYLFTLQNTDLAGYKCADKYKREYGIPSLMIPTNYKVTDPSDLVLKYGREELKYLLYQLINAELHAINRNSKETVT